MEKININISFNTENESITISGIKDSDIEINYSGDVDFTELVNSLIILIDKQKEVDYSIYDIPDDNEKLKLVIDTLTEILDKYNENINSLEDIVENGDDDFGVTNASDNVSNNMNDDLPF